MHISTIALDPDTARLVRLGSFRLLPYSCAFRSRSSSRFGSARAQASDAAGERQQHKIGVAGLFWESRERREATLWSLCPRSGCAPHSSLGTSCGAFAARWAQARERCSAWAAAGGRSGRARSRKGQQRAASREARQKPVFRPHRLRRTASGSATLFSSRPLVWTDYSIYIYGTLYGVGHIYALDTCLAIILS